MWTYILPLLAEADKVDPAAQPDPLSPMLTLGLPMLVIFYFFVMRPQMRQQKQAQEMVSQLKKNDRVMTKSGIFGTIYNIDKEKNKATIKIDEATNTKMEVLLSSLEYCVEKTSEEKPKE